MAIPIRTRVAGPNGTELAWSYLSRAKALELDGDYLAFRSSLNEACRIWNYIAMANRQAFRRSIAQPLCIGAISNSRKRSRLH